MNEVRPANMFQRRVFHHIIRGAFLLLGIFVLWRMISTITDSDKSSPTKEHTVEPKMDPVKIEVYYESMCPDSKYFVQRQLVPTLEKVPEITEFRLIPYGKAQTVENETGIYFTCQHLEKECQGNKIHACGIKYIENQSKLLTYTSCLFNNIRNPQAVGESCSIQAGVDWTVIDKCSNSREGSELLKMYGEETHSLNPSVTFIPTILLNGSQKEQKDILKNLLKEVCSRYERGKPSACL